MTNEQAREVVQRTDEFIAHLKRCIEIRLLHPVGGERQRQVLQRIADTLDRIEFVEWANLATMNKATRGAVMDLITVRLMACAGGPSLDFADAKDFLAVFAPLNDLARARYRRRLQTGGVVPF